jgi:hypothetical protein
MAAHVKNVSVKARMIDSDALLTPAVLDHIVDAVLEALDAREVDEHSRAHDTKIGACCDGCRHAEGAP